MIAPEVGTVIGGLRIDAVAGRGGMGVVYRAHELALDRTVAMKIVNPELANDPEFRERFRREARLAAALDHPHVVPVYRAGEDDGNLYLTMRYVDGTDLGAMIAEHGRIEPAVAVEIITQVASALDAAHARGLVHRDVKPANVLVARRDGRPHTYLTDFGISKDGSEDGMTRSGVVVGSLSYIAPEQLAGERADGRADVYALGCVLFQALTGEVPFPRDSTAAQMYAHLNAPPPPLGEKVPSLRGAMERVVATALAKRPQDRFASAGEFARAAQAALGGAGTAWAPSPRFPVPVPLPRTVLVPPPQHHPSFPSGRNPPLAFPGVAAVRPPARHPWLIAGAVAAVVLLMVAGVLIVVTNTPLAVPAPVALPSTGQFVGRPIPVGAGPVDVEEGGGYLWTANSAGGSVSRVDPAAGTSVEIPVGGQPTELGVGPKTVWAYNYLRSLTPIDIATGRSGTAVDTGFDFDHIAASDTRIWAVSADQAAIAAFDITTGAAVGTPIAAGERPAAITVGAGRVYVVDPAGRSLLIYDENTGAPLGAPVDIPDGITAIGYEGGHLYLGAATGFLEYTGAAVVTPDQIVTTTDSTCAVLGGPTTSWMYDCDGGSVRAFTPDLRVATGAPLPGLPAGISDAEYTGGRLWFLNRSEDSIRAVLPTS